MFCCVVLVCPGTVAGVEGVEGVEGEGSGGNRNEEEGGGGCDCVSLPGICAPNVLGQLLFFKQRG